MRASSFPDNVPFDYLSIQSVTIYRLHVCNADIKSKSKSSNYSYRYCALCPRFFEEIKLSRSSWNTAAACPVVKQNLYTKRYGRIGEKLTEIAGTLILSLF